MSIENSFDKTKNKNSGKLKARIKKAGLILGSVAATGLAVATLEGLKENPPVKNIEHSSENKKEDSETDKERMSRDLKDLEELNKKVAEQRKMDELRRFIAGQSKPGDELYSVGKDPFAVPGAMEYQPEYKYVNNALVTEEDDDLERRARNKHAVDFFESVIGDKFRIDAIKLRKNEEIKFMVDNGLCYITVEADGKYRIHNGADDKIWKIVDESQLEQELDNLKKRAEEGRKTDPFFSPFA